MFDRLARTADVMVVNFPLKVRARLRMRYEDVAPLNPRLIYASMTGYGESGPDAEQPGFELDGVLRPLRPARRADPRGRPARLLAAGAGRPDGRHEPVRRHRHGAPASRAHRRRAAKSATSLHAGGLWSNAMLAQGALLGAYVAPRPPRTKPRSALANQYRTSDGRWIQLTIVREDKLWPELCKAMERPDLLDDPRFQTTDSRRAHASELAAILDPMFAAHPWPEWRKRLRHHEITFGLLGVLRDVPDDEQAVANGAVVPTQPVRDAAHHLRADPPLLRARAVDARSRTRLRRAHRRGAGRAGLQRCRDRRAAHGGRVGVGLPPPRVGLLRSTF